MNERRIWQKLQDAKDMIAFYIIGKIPELRKLANGLAKYPATIPLLKKNGRDIFVVCINLASKKSIKGLGGTREQTLSYMTYYLEDRGEQGLWCYVEMKGGDATHEPPHLRIYGPHCFDRYRSDGAVYTAEETTPEQMKHLLARFEVKEGRSIVVNHRDKIAGMEGVKNPAALTTDHYMLTGRKVGEDIFEFHEEYAGEWTDEMKASFLEDRMLVHREKLRKGLMKMEDLPRIKTEITPAVTPKTVECLKEQYWEHRKEREADRNALLEEIRHDEKRIQGVGYKLKSFLKAHRRLNK